MHVLYIAGDFFNKTIGVLYTHVYLLSRYQIIHNYYINNSYEYMD